MSGLKR